MNVIPFPSRPSDRDIIERWLRGIKDDANRHMPVRMCAQVLLRVLLRELPNT